MRSVETRYVRLRMHKRARWRCRACGRTVKCRFQHSTSMLCYRQQGNPR